MEIPTQCFVNCQNFKKLVLPTTLRVIKQCAFYNTRMEEVTFPEGLERIEMAAFHGSGELKKAMLPNSCLELGDFAFSMCDSLKELRLPEGIKRIPNNFTSFCNVLEKVDIPENVEIIDENAFQWCFALKNIKFPVGLKTIGHTAFHYCNPDSIVFPESIQYIGGGSCRYWKNLMKIYSKSPIPPFCDEDPENPGIYSFGGLTSTDIPVYVPVGSADLYRNAQGWSYFKNFIETDEFPEAGIYGVKIDIPNQSKVYWTNGSLNIEILNDIERPVSYSIYTIEGRIVKQGLLESTHIAIPMAKGVYVVKVGERFIKIS
ncbi:MAG: leucine-rich repeat domain-containing protein [Muribaculaceae bacterium]|nr:leucine-rich repeat domain-containing protein [Muribaculaceae bacterium]